MTNHGARTMKIWMMTMIMKLSSGLAMPALVQCAPRWMRPVGGLPAPASPIDDHDHAAQLSALKSRQLGPRTQLSGSQLSRGPTVQGPRQFGSRQSGPGAELSGVQFAQNPGFTPQYYYGHILHLRLPDWMEIYADCRCVLSSFYLLFQPTDLIGIHCELDAPIDPRCPVASVQD